MTKLLLRVLVAVLFVVTVFCSFHVFSGHSRQVVMSATSGASAIAPKPAVRSVADQPADSPTAQLASSGSPLRVEVGQPVGKSPLRIELAKTETQSVPAPEPSPMGTQTIGVDVAQQNKVRTQLMSLPLRFEPNRGQAADHSQYIAQSADYEIHFSQSGAELHLSPQHSLPITLEGAAPTARIDAGRQLPGKSNYYLNADQSTWLTGIPNYAELHYEQVYPGVDLVFYGNRGRLEYDFVVAPQSDPRAVALRIPASAEAMITHDGNLQLKAGEKTVEFLKPVVYQTSDNSEGRRHVDGSYRLLADAQGTLVKFVLGEYDRSKALVIDPVLAFAEPSPGTTTVRGIQLDGSGNIYIAGENYNSPYGLQVTKLSNDGTTVLYSTSVANNFPTLVGFAVDGTGRAYVAAFASPGLPTTSSAYQASVSSGTHAYFAALDVNGGVTYASYFAGSSTDYTEGLAADQTGKAYIFGETCSTDFPTTLGPTPAGCYNPFVIKVDPSQTGSSSLVYSEILGTGNAYGLEGALDGSNNLYVALQVNSGGYTATSGAFQYAGIDSPYGTYIEKLDPSGNPGYLAYLGPAIPYSIAADGSGAVYVIGQLTYYYDFPTTPGAFDTNYPGGFLTKLSADGSTLVYSTFLAGPSGTLNNIVGTAVAVPPGCSSNCSVYFGGWTLAKDLPVANPIQNANLSSYSTGFFGQLNSTGSQANFLTYFGGSNESASTYCAYRSTCSPHLAADASGNMYVAGYDYSSDFPYTAGQNSTNNYVAKISPNNAALALAVPSTVTFPYSEPVGLSTASYSTTNPYYSYVNQTVTLRNMGSSAISISGISFQGTDFTETDNCSSGLAAGGTCQIQVQFDPTQSGPRSDTMTISSNAPNAPTVVQISGIGLDTGVLKTSASELDYGGVNVGSTAAQSLTISNVGNTSLQLYSFSISGPYTETDNCPNLLVVGTSCTVNITFSPSTTGIATGYFNMSTSSPYYFSSQSIPLNGSGVGVGATGLSIYPSSLVFPATYLGTSSANTYYVLVQNTGTVPVGINNVSTTGDFKISSNGCGTNYSLDPDHSCYVYVQFVPTAVGTRTGTLSILTSLSSTPQTLSLTGTGFNGTQAVVVNPSNLTFPDQPLGTVSSSYTGNQTIYFYNVGTGPVKVYRAYDDSGDFRIVSDGCSGTTINPNVNNNYYYYYSSCSITVEFLPSQLGARTGTITFVDNAPGSPHTVAVNGKGVAPTQVAVLNPTALAFADQITNTPSGAQSITFYNYGNVPITVSSVQSDNATEFAVSGGCGIPFTVSPGSSCYENVTFTPSGTGNRSAHINFTASDSAMPHTALVTGVGLSPTGSLEINPTSIPFGSQATMLSTGTVQVHVHNPGDSPVILTSVTPSLPDYVISSNGCTGTLYPQSDCYFYIAFDPTTTGPLNGTVTVASSNATSQGVNVTGTGLTASKALVVIAPSTMNWGNVTLNSNQGRLLYLRNIGTEPINISSIGGLTAPFSVNNYSCGSTLAVNTSCQMYVYFNPTTTGGPTSETLTITSDAAGSPQSLTVTGTAVSSYSGVFFQQNGLQFDQAPTGTTNVSGQQSTVLYNFSGSTITLGTATIGSGFTLGNSNCGSTLGSGSGCYYYVQESPTSTGLYNANLSVNVQGVNITAPMTGYGVTPASAVNLSQDGMLFPDQVMGTTGGVQTISVTNVGNSPVSFSPSSLGTSTDFIFYGDNCGTSFTTSSPLQPNSSCNVQLQFKPGSAANLMATLTINDSAGGHTVTLEGVGLAPVTAAEVRPGGISFPDTTAGLSSGQIGATLYNTGNVQFTFTANPQICTATGDPCTTSTDFAFGPSGGYCVTTYTMSVGYACNQYVAFTPQSAGPKTAVLRLNDPAGPHYVQLSGNGIAATSSVVANRTQWNFPDTPIGASSNTDYIYVTNTGTVPVTFGTLMSSSPEFALSSNYCANYASSGLPPGSQCYATMTFTPTGSTGSRTATLSIPTSAGNLSIAIQANAIAGTASLSFETTIVDFGQVPVGVQASQYVYLTNTGTLPVNLGTPSVSPTGEVSVSGCSGTLYSNSSCYMYVYITPAQTGSRSATITFNDSATGNPHTITVNATGITNQVSLSQTNLDFGSIAVGAQSPNVYVYYTNDNSSPVTISSVTLGGANPGDFSIYDKTCGGSVSANYDCYVALYFLPTATSTRSATLTIVDSTGTNQVVNLTGTGLPSAPKLSMYPSRIVFDSQPLNTTNYSPYLVITNKGTAALTFSGFNLQQSASDFAVYYNGCQGQSLAANQSCSIELSFTPSTTTGSSATLTITDNDSTSPQVVNITGTGQNGADLALSGNANPPSIQPGGMSTLTVIATNNGPQQADNVVLTMNLPTNASVQSVTPSAGVVCNVTNIISCSVASLAAGSNFNVAILAQNTTPGAMTVNAVVNTSSADPNQLNNDISISSNAGIADLQVVAATAPTSSGGQPAFAMVVTNNGPGSDDNVQATFDLNQFGFVSATSTSGSGCSFNGSQVVCLLGSLVAKASATITIVVQPPAYGWSSIEGYAKGTQPDPVPTNNLARITPVPEDYNTKLGTNVSVDTSDPQTGTLANVMFPTVTRPGVTALAAMPPATPPSGYRLPRANETFGVSSSAQYAGNLTVSLHYAAASFWHPALARLFHNENGVWVDRTAASAPGVVSAVTPSLSQFAILEPVNQAPTANPGAAMIVAATASAANVVQLDGSKSTDPENDTLTYKWTGPFPEGNGTVTGANPKVTLPVGVSQVTLVVNDGEVDSSPVTQAVTVSDFAVVANNATVSVVRGQGANVTLALSPKFGAFNNPVTLACGNLPTDLACQFSETSATPGVNGSSVTLTIVAAQTAALSKHGSPRNLAAWLLAMGMPFGFVLVTGDRKRLLARLGVLAIVLLMLYMAGCGGAGSNMSQTQTPPPPTSSTSTITVTGTSGSVQHSITLTVTRN